jgi:membrane-associated phospholipid phosphatase
MKKGFVALLFLCLTLGGVSSVAAQTDSLGRELESERESIPRKTKLSQSQYSFKASQLIAPAALVGLGATGLFVNPVRELNRDISSSFTGNKRRGFDDYVQYAPLLTPYVLKLGGVKSRHSYEELTILAATSYLTMGILVNTVKYSVGELRPDGSSRNSFPSGHTATAFMGAELLRTEFWDTSPWIGLAGYAVATTVGYMRVWHNRHWMTDVLAGAGVGILSVRIAYWCLPPLQRLFFGQQSRRNARSYASAAPYYNGQQVGLSFSSVF